MKNDFFLKLPKVFAALNEERVARGLKPMECMAHLRKKLQAGGCRVRFYTGKVPRYSMNDARKLINGPQLRRKKQWTESSRKQQAFVMSCMMTARRSRDMRAYGEQLMTAKEAHAAFNSIRRAAGRKTIKSINAWHSQAKRKNIPMRKGAFLTFFDAADIARWAIEKDARRCLKPGKCEECLPKAPRELELSTEWISCNEFAQIADIHVTTVRRHVYEGDLEGYVTSRLHEVLIHARTAAEFFLERANNFRRRRK